MNQNEYDAFRKDEMVITGEGISLLNDISKWARFLAVVGFIFLALMILGVISAGAIIMGSNNYMEMSGVYAAYNPGVFQWTYIITYTIIILIYFFPLYFLYQFANRTRKALKGNDSYELSRAWQSLRNHYMIIGILTIIALIFFVIALAMMVVGYGTYMW